MGTSLVAQWIGICLPMQGTWFQSLVQEDPTRHGASKPMVHNYWARALEPAGCNFQVLMLKLLKPMRLEPVLHNERSHSNEKLKQGNEEWPPLTTTS